MTTTAKILTLDQLLTTRRAAATLGKTVVHCHGCFDIVHPGHIQYLQFARSLGDMLIVTVSADPQVNKGINRPLIPDDLRAASLAALECVDAVYVNPHPTAVEILQSLLSDIYVKGREYETNQDPRFLAERDTVTRNGGRVVFSSGDVVYSSTALINALESADLFSDEKIRRYRQQHELSSARLQNLTQRFRGKRVVVIGDYILDRYHFCDATGIASEGPMMTLRPLQTQQYDGAAGVIALHLAALGASPTLITSLANDQESTDAIHRMSAAGVNVQAIKCRRQVVCKTRFIVDQTKVMKLDEGAVTPLDSRSLDEMAALIETATTGADAVIFADFGFGTITGPLLDRVLTGVRQRVPIVTADVSGTRSTLQRFHSVDLLCPTERELRSAMNNFSSGLNAVAHDFLQRTSAKAAVITLGKQGLCVFDNAALVGSTDTWDRTLRAAYLPAITTQAIDPLGCGDSLLAVATLALACGATAQAAAYLGALAAGAQAQLLGNQPIDLDRLLSAMARAETAPMSSLARLAS